MAGVTPARAVEVLGSDLGIAGEHVLDLQGVAERLIYLVVNEVGELCDLRGAQVGGWRSLSGMALAQKWPDLAPIAVAQDHVGTDQVRSSLRAPGVGAVAVDACGGVGCAAAVRRRLVHDVFVIRSRSTTGSGRRSNSWAKSSGPAPTRRFTGRHRSTRRPRVILDKVFQREAQVFLACFEAQGSHLHDRLLPLCSGSAASDDCFRLVA